MYWILGNFKGARNASEAALIKKQLLELTDIDIRRIIGPDSDVDVLSDKIEELNRMETKDYDVLKLDPVSFDRIRPETELGQTEINQGFIPAEKLRLSRLHGLSKPDQFRNAVREIISRKISMTFGDPQKFWETHYAKKGINHPSLLALRYIRLLAQDYFNRYGSGYPDEKLLLSGVDPKLQKEIKAVIASCLSDPRFKAFIQTDQGKKWFNGTLLKSFRSLTNPTAAFLLLKHFGVDELIAAYSEVLNPINQFLFLERRDPQQLKTNLDHFGVKESDLFEPLQKYFPEAKAFHGAGSLEAFRAIIFQNVIPSTSGTAGRGLYVVAKDNISFAEQWAENRAGRSDLVVEFDLDPKARIMDLTKAENKDLFHRWKSENPRVTEAEQETEFARAFGIDILIYDYTTQAFVIKNAAIIHSAQGHRLKLKGVAEMTEEARELKPDQWTSFLSNFILNTQIPAEVARILSELPKDMLKTALKSGELEKASLGLPTPADRARVLRSLWKGAKKMTDEKALANKLRSTFWRSLESDLEKIDATSAHSESMDYLFSVLPEHIQIAWLGRFKNPEFRRKLMAELPESPNSSNKHLTKAIDKALEDPDGAIQVMAAMNIIRRFDRDDPPRKNPLFKQAINSLLRNAENTASTGHEEALREIADINRRIFFHYPQALDFIAKAAESDPSPTARRIALEWMNSYLSTRLHTSSTEKQLMIDKTFPDPEASYTSLLTHPDISVRTFAAKGLVYFTLLNERSSGFLSALSYSQVLDIILKGLEYDEKEPMAPVNNEAYSALILINKTLPAWLNGKTWERLLAGFFQRTFKSSGIRYGVLKMVRQKLMNDPEMAPRLLEMYKNDPYPLIRVAALGAYLESQPQTVKNIKYLKEIISALSISNARISAEGLGILLRLSENLSKTYADAIIDMFPSIADANTQAELADMILNSKPAHRDLWEKLYPFMSKGPIYVQNKISIGFIHLNTPHAKEAFNKLFEYVEQMVATDKLPLKDTSSINFSEICEAVRGIELAVHSQPKLIPADSNVHQRLARLALIPSLDDFSQYLDFRKTLVEFLATRAEETQMVDETVFKVMNVLRADASNQGLQEASRNACEVMLRILGPSTSHAH